MNDLLSQVLPETGAIIWFPKGELDINSVHYRNVDYLCDGILTNSLSSLQEKSSLVLVGKNFGSSLLIFIARSLIKNEVESFLGLVPKEQKGDILVIDEGNLMPDLAAMVKAETAQKLKRVN